MKKLSNAIKESILDDFEDIESHAKEQINPESVAVNDFIQYLYQYLTTQYIWQKDKKGLPTDNRSDECEYDLRDIAWKYKHNKNKKEHIFNSEHQWTINVTDDNFENGFNKLNKETKRSLYYQYAEQKIKEIKSDIEKLIKKYRLKNAEYFNNIILSDKYTSLDIYIKENINPIFSISFECYNRNKYFDTCEIRLLSFEKK